MTNLKTSTLQKFDDLIAELELLIPAIPNRATRQRTVYDDPSKEQIEQFYRIRTRYIALLNSIPSTDNKVQQAIDYVRDVSVTKYNLRQVLTQMRGLRSDYEAGLLTTIDALGNKAAAGEQLLRDALHELENLTEPFPDNDIDRLENLIKRAVRVSFGEDSTQYKTIYEIFHPPAGIMYGGLSPTERRQEHFKKWRRNRQRLINAVSLMPDELRLIARDRQEFDSKQIQEAPSEVVPLHSKRWLDEPRAIIIAALIGILGILISYWLGQNNSLNPVPDNAVIITFTPSVTLESSATEDTTAEP